MCRISASLPIASLISTTALALALGGCGGKATIPGAGTGTGLPPAPSIVDQALLSQLQDELARVLAGRLAAEGGKIACAPPLGDVNRVANLACERPPGELPHLTWSLLSIGDYDQNGEVNVSDLTPLGANFGAVGPFDYGDVRSVIDGDGNGELNIGDVTPIGQQFGNQLVAYNVYASLDPGDYPAADDAPNGPGAVLLGTVPLAGAETPPGGRSQFIFAVTTPVPGYIYWVRPTDGAVDGSPSNQATAPPPLEWAHTWGGDQLDTLDALTMDPGGGVYVGGRTQSFGAASTDALLLKYSAEGEPLWAKRWGLGGWDAAYCLLCREDVLYAVGTCAETLNPTDADLLSLRFEADTGALISADAIGLGAADDGQSAWAMVADEAGNLYLAGQQVPSSTSLASPLLMKLNAAGGYEWSTNWLMEDGGSLFAVARRPGGVIAAGRVSTATRGRDVLLQECDENGNLGTTLLWDGAGGDDQGDGLAVDPAGNIYVVGTTSSWGMSTQVLLLKFDPALSLLWARTFGSSTSLYGNSVLLDGAGGVYICGTRFGTSLLPEGALMVMYDEDGVIQWARAWTGSSQTWAPAGSLYDGVAYRAGASPDVSGAWQDVNGTSTGVTGTFPMFASVLMPPLAVTVTAPNGEQIDPVGVIDTGGGDGDALVIRLVLP